MSKIYQPSGKAREYSPYALNYFNGCDHGCAYCYVPNMFRRFRAGYDHSELSVQNLKELELSAKKHKATGKQVLLSFTGDPYCSYNDKEKITRKVLNILLENNIKVSILTKGGSRCLQDLDIFKKFGDNIKVGASLILDDDKDSKKWEPGAASPNDRLSALEKLKSEGIKTWASFEPVLSPRQSINLMTKGLPFTPFKDNYFFAYLQLFTNFYFVYKLLL